MSGHWSAGFRWFNPCSHYFPRDGSRTLQRKLLWLIEGRTLWCCKSHLQVVLFQILSTWIHNYIPVIRFLRRGLLAKPVSCRNARVGYVWLPLFLRRSKTETLLMVAGDAHQEKLEYHAFSRRQSCRSSLPSWIAGPSIATLHSSAYQFVYPSQHPFRGISVGVCPIIS